MILNSMILSQCDTEQNGAQKYCTQVDDTHQNETQHNDSKQNDDQQNYTQQNDSQNNYNQQNDAQQSKHALPGHCIH